MRPFPGELLKEKSRSHPYVLNDEQKDWLRETFPVTENREIMKVMGVCWPTLFKWSQEMGLTKTEEGMKAIMERTHKKHRRMNKYHKMLLLSGQMITKCKNLRRQPYMRRQVEVRCSALDRGYLLDENISEGSRGRYAIYYDDETKRSDRFEATCKRYGFRVEKD